MNFLKLGFLANPELGLLILRAWLGLTMMINHGLPKLTHFAETAKEFPDPLHVGANVSLGLAVFAEVVCSALLVIGFFTRPAALMLGTTMGVAFFVVHKGSLALGPGSGELAFMYLAGYLTLLFAGAGRFSFDGDD
ncbi:MAG: DoxX family protein [Verrucomicrobiaceae bacterium]|nr:DoxX family protein [Verrucomicrobiaceae bacterium]